jgi:protein gp37
VFEDWQGPMVDHEGRPLFVAADWFTRKSTRDAVTMASCRRRLFELIDKTPWLQWQLVTKRPENVLKMWPMERGGIKLGGPGYRENVWLLTSVSNQKTFDTMILPLQRCRDLVPVLGLSAEPLLGEINVLGSIDKLDWIIAGGESGPGARVMKAEWARSLRDQCAAAGVPFFFKQGSQANWKDFKSFAEFPSDLQIREFPNAER